MPRPPRIDAVVFDYDGVVADTELPKCVYTQRQLSAVGVRMTLEDALTLAGGDDRKTVPELLRRLGSDMTFEEYLDAVPELESVYAKGDISPSPGLVDLIDSLRSRGVRIAIASSTDVWKLLVANERMGITQLFDVVVGGDTVNQRLKPAPDVYLEALRQLGVSADRAVAVEDSPFGIASAHAAGLYVVGYRGNPFVLDVSSADEVVDTFVGLEL